MPGGSPTFLWATFTGFNDTEWRAPSLQARCPGDLRRPAGPYLRRARYHHRADIRSWKAPGVFRDPVPMHVFVGAGPRWLRRGQGQKTSSWEHPCPWVSPPVKRVPSHFLGPFWSCSSEKESCFHALERESE